MTQIRTVDSPAYKIGAKMHIGHNCNTSGDRHFGPPLNFGLFWIDSFHYNFPYQLYKSNIYYYCINWSHLSFWNRKPSFKSGLGT